jgi:hypothetical protein
MYTSLLVSAGISLMIYSIYLHRKLAGIVREGNLRRRVNYLLVLIAFFLVGYAFFLAVDTMTKPDLVISLLVSMILFFGAVFVVSVLRITYGILSDLNEHVDKLQMMSKMLDRKYAESEQGKRELAQEEERLASEVKKLRKDGGDGELVKKMAELQQFQKIAVGRELRMVELKKKLKALEDKKAS